MKRNKLTAADLFCGGDLPHDRGSRMKRTITNCDNCGACCFAQVSPPGYTGQEMVFFSTPEDERRFHRAPREAQDLVWAWQDRVDSLADGEPLPFDEPCCWLDPQTNRCRFYRWRPSVCRDFEPGSEGCLAWRDEYNIDVQLLT